MYLADHLHLLGPYQPPRSRWYKYVTVGLGALATAAVGGEMSYRIRAARGEFADSAQQASADSGLRPTKSETVAAGESRVAQRNESTAVTVRPEYTFSSAVTDFTPRD